MKQAGDARKYQAMTLADLASLLKDANQWLQWRPLTEFLEEYRSRVSHYLGIGWPWRHDNCGEDPPRPR